MTKRTADTMSRESTNRAPSFRHREERIRSSSGNRTFPPPFLSLSHTQSHFLSLFIYLSISFLPFLSLFLAHSAPPRSFRPLKPFGTRSRVIVMQMIFAQAKNHLGEAKRVVRLQKRILRAATRMGKSAGASRHLLEPRSAAISDFLCNYAAP